MPDEPNPIFAQRAMGKCGFRWIGAKYPAFAMEGWVF
jgi:hypothetical protein